MNVQVNVVVATSARHPLNVTLFWIESRIATVHLHAIR